jgi:hypothetical protein
MTGAAFDEIKAGLDEARRYLDGSADRRNFRTSALSDAKANIISTQAQSKDRP